LISSFLLSLSPSLFFLLSLRERIEVRVLCEVSPLTLALSRRERGKI
jgi:hypothetical protein